MVSSQVDMYLHLSGTRSHVVVVVCGHTAVLRLQKVPGGHKIKETMIPWREIMENRCCDAHANAHARTHTRSHTHSHTQGPLVRRCTPWLRLGQVGLSLVCPLHGDWSNDEQWD